MTMTLLMMLMMMMVTMTRPRVPVPVAAVAAAVMRTCRDSPFPRLEEVLIAPSRPCACAAENSPAQVRILRAQIVRRRAPPAGSAGAAAPTSNTFGATTSCTLIAVPLSCPQHADL